MKKNYLFPHRFKVIGWVLSVAAVVAYFCIRDLDFKMPALSLDILLYGDDILLDGDDEEGSFFRMANTNIISIAMPLLTIGLLFIGFSKEKVEDEFVHYLRAQSLIWATYVTSAFFIIATLLIYGIAYIYVPYLVFFVFLILFIVKFRIELYRFNKGGAQ